LVILCVKQKPLVREQQSNGNRRGKYQEEGLESDGLRKDLETLEVADWEDRVQDRDYWRTVTVVAKILKEL